MLPFILLPSYKLTLRWMWHARYELTQNGVGFDNWDVFWAETKHYPMHIADLVWPFILSFRVFFFWAVYCSINPGFYFWVKANYLRCNAVCLPHTSKFLQTFEPLYFWHGMKAFHNFASRISKTWPTRERLKRQCLLMMDCKRSTYLSELHIS